MHEQPFLLPQVRAGNPEPVQGREETEEKERGMTMDILVYKDGRFVCTENPLKADSLEGLAMLVTNPQDGDVLKYDAASGTWLNGTGSDFAPTITSPQNGQVIKYNGTAWVNGAASGGGVTIVHMNDETGALDKTAQELFTAARSSVVMLGFDIEGIFAFSMLLAASDKEGETSGTTAYSFLFAGSDNGSFGLEFVADSLNGYPVISVS